jgi:hypothetical protein
MKHYLKIELRKEWSLGKKARQAGNKRKLRARGADGTLVLLGNFESMSVWQLKVCDGLSCVHMNVPSPFLARSMNLKPHPTFSRHFTH